MCISYGLVDPSLVKYPRKAFAYVFQETLQFCSFQHCNSQKLETIQMSFSLKKKGVNKSCYVYSTNYNKGAKIYRLYLKLSTWIDKHVKE